VDGVVTALLVAAVAVSRIAALPSSVAAQDEAYLAAAVIDLDPTADRPFPPWAFGWVLLGRLLMPVVGRPDLALCWAGVVFGTWLLFPLSALASRLVRRDLGVLVAVVALAAPGVWLLAPRGLTDTAGSALLAAALASWLGTDDRRRHLSGGVFVAAALLVRPQLAPVLTALVVWRAVTSEHRTRVLAAPLAAAIAWCATAWWTCGGWTPLRIAVRSHLERHLTGLEGHSFTWSEWCGFRVLGSSWAGAGWWLLAAAGIALLLATPSTRRSAGVTYGLVLVPLAAASTVVLNGTLARYGLPLVVLTAPAVAAATAALMRAATPAVAGAAVVAWVLQAAPAAAFQRLQPSPAVTAIAVADARAAPLGALVVADDRLHGFVTLYRAAGALRAPWAFELELRWGSVTPPSRIIPVVEVRAPAELGPGWRRIRLRQPLLEHLAAGRWTGFGVGPPQPAETGSSGVTAASSVAPLRIRTTRSTGTTKILPSPTSPVRAADTMASTVGSTKWSETPISSRTFSTSSILTVVPR
jgi:hypothetical protein